MGKEKGEELHYFYSHLSPPGVLPCRVIPPHNRTAPGIPHPAAHTSHKLPHRPGTAGFSVGLPNSACSRVSWAPGWERTAGPKAGNGRKGIEGLPAAHWAVSGIQTAPNFKNIINNCAVTSQTQKNEELKVAKRGLAPWNTLNSLMLPSSTASLAVRGREGKGSWTSSSRNMQGPLPASETAPKQLPGELLLKPCQPELLPP